MRSRFSFYAFSRQKLRHFAVTFEPGKRFYCDPEMSFYAYIRYILSSGASEASSSRFLFLFVCRVFARVRNFRNFGNCWIALQLYIASTLDVCARAPVCVCVFNTVIWSNLNYLHSFSSMYIVASWGFCWWFIGIVWCLSVFLCICISEHWVLLRCLPWQF